MNIPFILSKKGFCKGCKADATFTLWRQISTNSAHTYFWQCQCGTKNPERGPQWFIPKETVAQKLTAEQMDLLPTSMPALYERCARCGERGTESHHWAPVAIFGREEADKWPRDYLCKDCHTQWHNLVTPQLTSDGW